MLTLLPTSSLPALVPKAPFLRPLMKACHHHSRELQLPGAGMPVHHHIHGCLCFPFLYQSLGGSRTMSVITKLKESRFMQLCTCHSFTLLQNLSSRQGRVEIGFKGACFTDLPVCSGCNFPSSQRELCSQPATFFHILSCIPL